MYELSEFAEKLNIQNCVYSMGNCVHYMYGLFGFVENANIQNGVNSMEIVYTICMKCQDLQKN